MANLQTLQDLATLFAANQQANPPQDTGPKMIVAGGKVMGRDVSQPSGMQNTMTSLGSLATNFIRMQQLQKRNQFFGEVNKVMGSAADVEEKKNLMRQLITQNGGEDYGLGIKDVLWKDMTETKEWKPRTKEEALNFEEAKAGIKKAGGKTLISPQINKLSANEDAYSSLGQSVTSLEANRDRFAQFMGPGKGALRNPMRSYVNKDLQDFLAWKANVQDAFQQYRVAVTGAQASDKEIALLAKNRPTEADTYDVFVKKAKEVRKVGNQVLSRYIKNLGKAGYDVSGYQDTLDNLNADLEGMTGGQVSTTMPEQSNALTATNPKTGKKIQSTDGGKTWQSL